MTETNAEKAEAKAEREEKEAREARAAANATPADTPEARAFAAEREYQALSPEARQERDKQVREASYAAAFGASAPPPLAQFICVRSQDNSVVLSLDAVLPPPPPPVTREGEPTHPIAPPPVGSPHGRIELYGLVEEVQKTFVVGAKYLVASTPIVRPEVEPPAVEGTPQSVTETPSQKRLREQREQAAKEQEAAEEASRRGARRP